MIQAAAGINMKELLVRLAKENLVSISLDFHYSFCKLDCFIITFFSFEALLRYNLQKSKYIYSKKVL
jgi:hypothetical protein